MKLEPGQIVDRYEVVGPLGEGGMAGVYLVRHTTLNSQHALKVLTLDRPGLRDRLIQEGRVQAALKHDCAVTVTDVVDVDGAPGLIMEYVDGPTLEAWIQTDPPLDERLHLFQQVVGAVAAAHGMGMVHRDLKPANVLVETLPDGSHRAKVTDFGIAKLLAEGEGAGKTRSGTTMGTPAYMAPEQMKDASTVDHRADIWALGAILYELVTGEVALGQGTLVETWERAKTADFEDPATKVPGLPPAVAATIRGALEPDPERRTPSCEALLDTLDSGISHAPAPTVPAVAGATGPNLAVFGGLGVIGIGVAVAGISLMVCLSSLGGGGEPEACSPGWFGTTGYARASGFFRWGEGDTWRLPRQIEVYPSIPGDGEDRGEPTCVLPAGTEVVVGDHPVKAQGRTWVWVGARSFTLPEPDDE